MRNFNEKFNEMAFEPDYPQESKLREDSVGITERAHMIMDNAHSLSSVIRTLRAVNMDRMADDIESVQHHILMLAKEMPIIVNKELNEGIAHGQHMMGGLLMVAMKLGDKEGEVARLKAGQK
jgi:hypothetical protein